ncbi:uncharacterized protein LOC118605502 [Rousettus aegyptiacus]|uniref:uncharacterized protein LOC118605502 n=1 Tax=Rousettus aegyptiacus TaxID=9407 RepID=UPI00168D61D6|nr:uncharacterized protein LOC118605502 [Rousettus aegyptiacus]
MDLGLVAALAVGVVKAPVEEGCPKDPDVFRNWEYPDLCLLTEDFKSPPPRFPEETASLAEVFAARHPLLGCHYLSRKTPNSTGPGSLQFDTPREPTHNPSRALGRPPRRRQFLTGQKCPGASRDNRLRAPRPAPAARAALHAREHSRRQGRSADGGQRRLWRAWICSGLTVSSAAAAGRRGRLGEDTIWQRLQLLPAASSSRLWEEAATSRQRQLRWRPRQHHIPLLLASSLTLRPPPPLPWQRGAKEISPAPPSRPCLPRPLGRGAGPAPSRPLPPPTEGPGPGPRGCPERPVGKEGGGCGVRKGGARTEDEETEA